MFFESTHHSKTGNHLVCLFLQQAVGKDFTPVPRVADKIAEADRSAHNATISYQEISQGSIRQVHVSPQAREEARMFLTTANPEYLTQAKFVHPSEIELTFADGMKAIRKFAELEIDPAELQLETIRASSAGTSLEVRTRNHRKVYIDSAPLRALVDPAYAEKMTQAYLNLRRPLEELEAITVAKPQLAEQ
jgi:hypothetical protein